MRRIPSIAPGHAITAAQCPAGVTCDVILVFGSINVDVLVPVPRAADAGRDRARRRLCALARRQGRQPGPGGAPRRGGGHDGRRGRRRFLRRASRCERCAATASISSLVRRVDRPTGCAAIMVGRGRREPDRGGLGRQSRGRRGQRSRCGCSVPKRSLVCQMEVPAAQNWALIRRARAAGARIVLNLAPAAPIDPALFAEIDVLDRQSRARRPRSAPTRRPSRAGCGRRLS